MSLSLNELLRKAVLETDDFGGAGEAPLSVQQVREFINLMAAEAVMLQNVRIVDSSAATWEESILDFSARVARLGTESTRLDSSDRVAPSTGNVTISTVLLRAEVPVSDEVYEDNVAEAGFANTIEAGLASRFGFDVEDLLVNGDTAGAGYLAGLDGWLEQAQDESGGNSFDASSYGQDYQEIFKQLLVRIPQRHLRNMTQWRYFVPVRLEQKWRDILASRGTALGDISLQEGRGLLYQGIPILGVPTFDAGITAGTPDTGEILLSHPQNLYAGFHRRMKFETWRDPREGAMSFIVTARVDAEVAIVAATAHAYSVNVEP